MEKYYLKLILILLISFNSYVHAQNCENITPSGDLTLNNQCVIVSASSSINNLSLSGEVTIEVPKDVTFTVNTNINMGTATKINLIVKGELVFGNGFRALKSTDITIFKDGHLKIGSLGNGNIDIQGDTNTIINHGKFSASVLGFTSENQKTEITNYGTINLTGNVNINSGTTLFYNLGVLSISSNYSNNEKSTYINCGEFNSGNGFNLKGGKIINTGTFVNNGGNIDMGVNTSYFENTGIVLSKGGINGSGKIVNKGRFVLNQLTFTGDLTGPSEANKYGFFYVLNQIMNPNNMHIGPNLVFRKIANIDNPENYTTFSFLSNQTPKYVKSYNTDGTRVLAANAADANVKFGNAVSNELEVYITNSCPVGMQQNCTNPGNTEKSGLPSVTGISTLQQEKENWPSTVKNGQLVINSATKGLVLSRTESSLILNPVQGMLIYDTKDKCIKMYTTAKGWNCLTKVCYND